MQEHEVGHIFSGHYRTLVETEPNLRSLSGLLSAHEEEDELQGFGAVGDQAYLR